MSGLFPEIQNVESPIRWRTLRGLDPRVRVVQFNSLPNDRDLMRLSALLERYPDVTLRAYGGYDGSITNLDFLRFFPRLRRFDATALRYHDLDSLDGLHHLPDDLIELSLGPLPKRFSLAPLTRFGSLQTLYLEGNPKNLDVIGELTSLTDLTLRSVTLPDLTILLPLKQLRSLDIKLGGTSDLALLPQLSALAYLELWGIRGLNDIQSVGEATSLQFLFLQDLSRVERLPDLSAMTSLRRINIYNLKRLTDLSPLRDAPVLEEVLIVDARHLGIEQLECLVGHPTLKAFDIGFGSKRKNDGAKRLLPLPRPGAFKLR